MPLRETGLTIRLIAAKLGVPATTVYRTCSNYYKTRSYYSNRARSGHPRKLRLADAKFIALSLSRNRLATAAQLRRDYYPHVSTETVRRCLRDLGIKNYARRRIPLLTKRHLKARRDWAQDHATWSARDWRRVMFSDESKFDVYGSDGPLRCWRRPGLALNPHYTRKMVKHGGGNIMVWGCITAEGVGQLHHIEGRLTAIRYTEILEDKLLETFREHSLPPCHTIFQHDNDPKHTAIHTRNWITEHRLSLLPWPANSPDMNPIENVWDYLDRQIRMHPHLPRNAKELWEVLQEEWECIPQSFIDKLYDSMVDRVDELIAQKGGNTRY
ncbi:hypothetical protein OPQ81_001158 [Rhizoctonia solani]|nr:hypothetical protein OPQ81_001158 [Rhizoctonia solani]